jgi:hypothetical protein
VNFALANEFADLGEYYRVDVHRILEMVNEDYPRANVPRPGPTGGPCLSKDGYFLVEELTLPGLRPAGVEAERQHPSTRRATAGPPPEVARSRAAGNPGGPSWGGPSSGIVTIRGSPRPSGWRRSWRGRVP